MELSESIKILRKLQQDMSSYNDIMAGEFGDRQIEAIEVVLKAVNNIKNI